MACNFCRQEGAGHRLIERLDESWGEVRYCPYCGEYLSRIESLMYLGNLLKQALIHIHSDTTVMVDGEELEYVLKKRTPLANDKFVVPICRFNWDSHNIDREMELLNKLKEKTDERK